MTDTMATPPAQDPLLRVASPRKGRPEVVPTNNKWRAFRVNNYVFALLGLVLLLGTIQVSQAAGAWTTSGKVTAAGEMIVATGANPDEIKGWMTISEVTEAYGVSVEELYAKFDIPATVPTTAQVKEIEKEAPDFSVDDLRTWLKERAAGGAGE